MIKHPPSLPRCKISLESFLHNDRPPVRPSLSSSCACIELRVPSVVDRHGPCLRCLSRECTAPALRGTPRPTPSPPRNRRAAPQLCKSNGADWGEEIGRARRKEGLRCVSVGAGHAPQKRKQPYAVGSRGPDGGAAAVIRRLWVRSAHPSRDPCPISPALRNRVAWPDAPTNPRHPELHLARVSVSARVTARTFLPAVTYTPCSPMICSRSHIAAALHDFSFWLCVVSPGGCGNPRSA